MVIFVLWQSDTPDWHKDIWSHKNRLEAHWQESISDLWCINVVFIPLGMHHQMSALSTDNDF